jgi:hypothetical protein
LSKKDVDSVSKLADNQIVSCHNKTIERNRWIKSKAKLIARFGTIEEAARQLDCHYNSIRYAVAGRCPGVYLKLKKWL